MLWLLTLVVHRSDTSKKNSRCLATETKLLVAGVWLNFGRGVNWNWRKVWEITVVIWRSAYLVVASHVWNADVIGLMYAELS